MSTTRLTKHQKSLLWHAALNVDPAWVAQGVEALAGHLRGRYLRLPEGEPSLHPLVRALVRKGIIDQVKVSARGPMFVTLTPKGAAALHKQWVDRKQRDHARMRVLDGQEARARLVRAVRRAYGLFRDGKGRLPGVPDRWIKQAHRALYFAADRESESTYERLLDAAHGILIDHVFVHSSETENAWLHDLRRLYVNRLGLRFVDHEGVGD